MTLHILAPSDPATEVANLRQAFDEAVRLCHEMSGIEEVIVYAPMSDIEGTNLEPVLSPEVVKALTKHKHANSPQFPVELKLATDRTLRRAIQPSILVAVFSDDKLMDKVELPNAMLRAVIAHPHVTGAVQRWCEAWSACALGSTTTPAQGSQISDLVVEKAMEDLTRQINLANGILGARDKESMQEVVNALSILGHKNEPATALRAWAVSHGWKVKAANELEKYASRVFGLKNKPKSPQGETLERYRSRWI